MANMSAKLIENTLNSLIISSHLTKKLASKKLSMDRILFVKSTEFSPIYRNEELVQHNNMRLYKGY